MGRDAFCLPADRIPAIWLLQRVRWDRIDGVTRASAKASPGFATGHYERDVA